MATVFIPAVLRPLADGVTCLEVEGQTVRDLVVSLEQFFPRLQGRLLDQGRLRPGVVVAVDSAISVLGLRHPVQKSSEVHFLAAIGGG